MKVSFQTTNFYNDNIQKQNHAKSTTFGIAPTPQSIERNRRIRRDDTITMVAGTLIGATIGALKYSKKVIPGYIGAGVIGGVLGYMAGRVAGFLIHPIRVSE